MLDKQISPRQAVSLIKNGDTVIFGGWGASRKPMAIVREIVRSDLRDLTIISVGGLDADLLISANKVKKVIYAYLGYQQIPGMSGNCRRVRQDGSVEMVELSEGMFVLGLRAAAEGLPLMPTRSGLGTDVLTVNPDIKTIVCPYTGATLVAMPALRGNVTFLHVNAASPSGYGQIKGDIWLDRLMARASSKTIISTEQVGSLDELKEDRHTIQLLRLWVDGVVEIPYGAHPTNCFPKYGIDQEKLNEYTHASTTPDSSAAYLDKYVRSNSGQQEYIDLMGGTTRLSQIGYE